ncbi:Rieske 2Fe-2S domain-containing protein [Candidatus Synechococcus calcipolaris G9]|uniref:Rieske 2Fe-2S domain-containing protein n=1 Tax=Candidatus Synechococcus calcipolaris G9 TaxID=1497997 RepID=A0ABT6EV04_9SYNE|nr:Rieske 2Fe-2S domain-containing protein [Candidatus Synechococcus calcipolaris]MDG2989669.1 Rieske 2Fe-2S domain-containing protein [Candidatus Synechococcus calcipolaris G9]
MLKNSWYAVEQATAVGQQPKSTQVLGQDIVLWRSPQGELVAMADHCLHRGAKLSQGWIEQGCLTCPYHGWRYTPEGICVHIPANDDHATIPKRAHLKTYPVQEKYGLIWLYWGDLPPDQGLPIPPLPEYATPGWRAVYGESLWPAHFSRVTEGNMDSSHAPFVHSSFFSLRNDAVVPSYDVDITPSSVSALTVSKPPKRVGLLKFILKRDRPLTTAQLTAYLPGVNRIDVDFKFRGYRFIYFGAHTPITATTTRTQWIGLRNFLPFSWADGHSRKNIIQTYEEDCQVIATMRPAIVPFHQSSEVLVASDALQVAYRKLLRQYADRGWWISEGKDLETSSDSAEGVMGQC